MRLERDSQNPAIAKYAFVCFKSPDLANNVKQMCSQQSANIGGQKLFVTNYEPKEVRMIQQAEVRDRADYSNAISQTTGGGMGQFDQIIQKPELVQTLMFIMQHLQSGSQRRGPGAPRQGGMG